MSDGTFQVHSGVPIPPVTRSGARTSKYPFATMKVEDMFFVPNASKTFGTQASAAGRRLKRKFSVRRVTVEGQPGMGCWRVE